MSDIYSSPSDAADKTQPSATADASTAEKTPCDQPAPSGPANTPGEKVYYGTQFFIGKVAIMASTAVLAYIAKYGKPAYGPVPNYLNRFQGWMHNKLLTNKVMPLAEKGEAGERMAGAIANTMVLFHGGNAFAPVQQKLENNHEAIVTAVNQRWGTPEEVAAAHERLKDKPRQNWSDVLKGRLAAWGLIFGSFTAADAVIGKDKKTGLYYFDKYEEWFGRKIAGMTKSGRDIGKVPVGQALTATQDANKIYRFSKILALDLYATSAAIMVWSFVSRLSAEKRQCKQEAKNAAEGNAPPEETGNTQTTSFADKNKPHAVHLAANAPKFASYRDAVAAPYQESGAETGPRLY